MSTLSNETAEQLLKKARSAQKKAYAPYSKYKVGASILAKSGKIYSGANIENQSYGDTICAERTAIGNMIMGGDTEIIAIAVVTKDEGYPCGICLQAINEFAPEPKSCQIVVPSKNGFVIRSLHELAPFLWKSDLVKKHTKK